MKQARLEHKRERRATRATHDDDDTPPVRPEADVLAELASLHEAHRDGLITFEDFELTKASLVAQLRL